MINIISIRMCQVNYSVTANTLGGELSYLCNNWVIGIFGIWLIVPCVEHHFLPHDREAWRAVGQRSPLTCMLWCLSKARYSCLPCFHFQQVLSLFCSVTPCYCRYAGAQNCPPCWRRRRKQPDRHWADSLKNRCTSPSSPFCPKYSTLNTPQPPPYPSCQTKHQTASKKCGFEDQYWGELKLIVTTKRLRRWWQQNADIMIVKMLKKMRVVALSPAYHPLPLPRRNITPFADKPP